MNDRHIVRSYDEELALLKTRLVKMGRLTQDQLDKAVETLISRDNAAAEAIAADDAPINTLQQDIDKLTLSMLARRQPMALETDRARDLAGETCPVQAQDLSKNALK